MRAVRWEKHAQIQLDLPHRVIGLPPVSQCICFNGLILLWRSTKWYEIQRNNIMSLTLDDHMGLVVCLSLQVWLILMNIDGELLLKVASSWLYLNCLFG